MSPCTDSVGIPDERPPQKLLHPFGRSAPLSGRPAQIHLDEHRQPATGGAGGVRQRERRVAPNRRCAPSRTRCSALPRPCCAAGRRSGARWPDARSPRACARLPVRSSRRCPRSRRRAPSTTAAGGRVFDDGDDAHASTGRGRRGAPRRRSPCGPRRCARRHRRAGQTRRAWSRRWSRESSCRHPAAVVAGQEPSCGTDRRAGQPCW